MMMEDGNAITARVFTVWRHLVTAVSMRWMPALPRMQPGGRTNNTGDGVARRQPRAASSRHARHAARAVPQRRMRDEAAQRGGDSRRANAASYASSFSQMVFLSSLSSRARPACGAHFLAHAQVCVF